MNYNPTPKNEYCSSPAMVKAHRELVETATVRVAIRAALAQYSRELSEVRPTDDPAGYAGVALRLRGAQVLIYGNADKGSLYLVQTLSGAAVHPVLGVTSVWDVGTNTPTLINYVLTDSASGAASKLMEFIVGGSSKFALRKDGQLTLAGGLIATTGAFSGSLSANTITLCRSCCGIRPDLRRQR